MSEFTELFLLPPTEESERDLNAAQAGLHERDIEALISEFRSSGEWPTPTLLSEILARGEEAVIPLITFVRYTDVEDPLAYYAVELLILLGDPAALPEITRFFHDANADFSESFGMSLPAMGPAVMPYLLPFVADRSLDWYQRITAVEIMQQVIGDDQNLRRELIKAINGELEAYLAEAASVPALAEKAKNDFYEAVSWLVSDLADLGAVESLPLMQQAFDADLVDEMIVGPEILTDPLSYKASEYTPTNWLEWYADDYEHRNDPPVTYAPRPERLFTTDRYAVAIPLKPYIAPPKPGRNDACWCGSGKKYKKCHLGKPEDKFAGG